jgi:hypothetical protein
MALGAGWLWGASGRWSTEDQLRSVESRAQLAEARAALASARVDLFELNYGQASRHLEQARGALAESARHMDEAGRTDSAEALREAIARAAEAQQLSASVDSGANPKAAEAVRALDRAMQPQK